jgi:hypothetical protein
MRLFADVPARALIELAGHIRRARDRALTATRTSERTGPADPRLAALHKDLSETTRDIAGELFLRGML